MNEQKHPCSLGEISPLSSSYTLELDRLVRILPLPCASGVTWGHYLTSLGLFPSL